MVAASGSGGIYTGNLLTRRRGITLKEIYYTQYTAKV